MSKKIILLLAILLSTLTASSQTVGQWDIYPTFNTIYKTKVNPTKIVGTPDKMYFLVGNQLCSIENNNETGELFFYTSKNLLNDNYIDNIFYNSDKKYLLIIYENSNIDLLYDNGKVVNMSEIKDVVAQKGKKINDVAFLPSQNKIFMAASFGIVVYDDKNYSVVESGIYNDELTGISVINDNVLVNMKSTKTVVSGTDNNGNPIEKEMSIGILAYSPISARHISQNSFKPIGETGYPRLVMEGLGDNKLVAVSQPTGDISIITLGEGMGSFDLKKYGSGCGYLSRGKDKFFTNSTSELFTIDMDANCTVYPLRGELATCSLGFYENPSKLWRIGYWGKIGCYNLNETGSYTQVRAPFKPNVSTARRVLSLNVSKEGKVYPIETRTGLYHTQYQYYGEDSTSCVNSYKDGIWKEEYRIGGVSRAAEKPSDPNTLIVSSYWGMSIIVDGGEAFFYNAGNIPFYTNKGSVPDFDFDNQGNMWILYFPENYNDSRTCPIYMLTANKVGEKNISKDDWKGYKFWKELGLHGARIIACKKSPSIVAFGGGWKQPVGVMSTESPSNMYYTSNLIDQDGKSFMPEYILSMAEDQNGKVWVTSTDGVFEITDPVKFLTTKTINRIKVPRNDGTNFADYLLDGIVVSGVAVDSSNRKWLTTVGSGIYLVNEDGSEILEHFDTSNSEVPTNDFYSVAVDPTSSKVYFGTTEGLVEYIGNSSPAAGDYSDVYAYPNPVRPDYTGWITVTNLMDNSLVKITDAAGFVLYSTTSEGGMVTWDGCNSAGERVKTGVYYVWASQNSDGKSSGVVTKILVVN